MYILILFIAFDDKKYMQQSERTLTNLKSYCWLIILKMSARLLLQISA